MRKEETNMDESGTQAERSSVAPSALGTGRARMVRGRTRFASGSVRLIAASRLWDKVPITDGKNGRHWPRLSEPWSIVNLVLLRVV